MVIWVVNLSNKVKINSYQSEIRSSTNHIEWHAFSQIRKPQ